MSDAERFLSLIGGPFIEIHQRLPSGGMASRFFRDSHAAAAFTLGAGGYLDIFAGMAPRVRQRGRSDDVEQAHIVSVDCDDDASLDTLASFDPAPSLIVASASLTTGARAKVHGHWPLRDACSRDELEDARQRLALTLGSDRSICDAARIMRVPGTGNFSRRCRARSRSCVSTIGVTPRGRIARMRAGRSCSCSAG